MIKIAVSKGRVAEDVIKQLGELGYLFSEAPERQLWVVDSNNRIQLLFIKSQDVTTYVDGGYVDLGIVGRDVLLESDTSSFEVLDIKISKCRMVLAGPRNRKDTSEKYMRLASKYPKIAKRYLDESEKNGEITSLQGSLELAPFMGISDYIVDLVESGKTLAAHDLIVYKELFKVSSVLIANKNTYKDREVAIKPFIANWAERIG